MKKHILHILLFLGLVLSCRAATYLMEAEHLQGDWNTVGSKYAQGKQMICSKTKGDVIEGSFHVPEDGSYYVFLRSMSFGDNWRKTTVAINGAKIGTAGDEKFSETVPYLYLWSQVAPTPVTLKKGEPFLLTLQANSSCSRVDAIVLTDTPEMLLQNSRNVLADGSYEELVLAEKPEFSGELNVNVTTDRAAISYHCNEPIRFLIRPMCNGIPMEKGFVTWSYETDDGQSKSGLTAITGKEPITVSVTLTQPGFVRFKADLLDSRKRPLKSSRGNALLSFFDGGAGADISQIKEMPEPADFDAYWEEQKKALQTIPLKAEAVPCGTLENGCYRLFAVSVSCLGKYRATGWMTIPANAQPQSLPIVITFAGYGTSRPHAPKNPVSHNAIGLTLNAHGMELQEEEAYYQKRIRELSGYAIQETDDDPRNSYFNGMVLRILRMLEYLKTRPEWNRKELTVKGGSQGGLQAIWAAALDHDVTRCISSITWGSNIGGTQLGYMGQQNVCLSYNKARGYFDSIHHAKRVQCPTEVPRIGLGDYTCPPSGITRMYFNLKCPKKVSYYQNSDHSKVIGGCEIFSFENNEVPR